MPRPAQAARHDFAGCNADVDRQRLAGRAAKRGHRTMNLGRGAHRANRVVAVRDRRAEHRHHRIADVLVDAAAKALDDLVGGCVEPLEQRMHVLRIERPRHPRVIDEVREDDGDRSPLAIAMLARSPGSRRTRE